MTLVIFSRWPTRTMFFALGIVVGVLYLATLAPSVLWGDSAGFQRRAYYYNRSCVIGAFELTYLQL